MRRRGQDLSASMNVAILRLHQQYNTELLKINSSTVNKCLSIETSRKYRKHQCKLAGLKIRKKMFFSRSELIIISLHFVTRLAQVPFVVAHS